MKAALTRYRVLAYLTGVMLLLLTLHIIVQLIQVQADGIPFDEARGLGQVWGPLDPGIALVHGYVYLVYVVLAFDLWFRFKTRLPLWQTALVVLAGVIPGMTFVAERWVTHRVTAMLHEQGTASTETASARQ